MHYILQTYKMLMELDFSLIAKRKTLTLVFLSKMDIKLLHLGRKIQGHD